MKHAIITLATVLGAVLLAAAGIAMAPQAGASVRAISCDAGYAPWALSNGTLHYLNSEGVDHEDEVGPTATSCWHVPANTDTGAITNESGNALDYDASDGYVLTASGYDGALSEQWTAEDFGSGVVFVNTYGTDHNVGPDLGEVSWVGVSLIGSPADGLEWIHE